MCKKNDDIINEFENVSYCWSCGSIPSGNVYTLHLRNPKSHAEILNVNIYKYNNSKYMMYSDCDIFNCTFPAKNSQNAMNEAVNIVKNYYELLSSSDVGIL